MQHRADIGVFGGSGFYKFLDDVHHVWIETPYGPTSDQIALAEVGGRLVIETQRNRGFVLEASLPLEHAA